MLKENLEEVEEKIAKACERAGRAREEVTLIAVSKTKSTICACSFWNSSGGFTRTAARPSVPCVCDPTM